MSRTFALLTVAAFALSAPIQARTLLAVGEPSESIAVANASVEDARPECKAEATREAGAIDATGGMPDTESAAVEAQVTACCWYYHNGRWYCFSC